VADPKLTAPKGTFDVLPEDAMIRRGLLDYAGEVLGDAGYEPFETPVFEATELFARGVGETTDIVQKEMFTFEDMGGRSLTLRPEGTAPVVRAYIDHGMHKWPQPVKLRYDGPYFRHEAPQAGRYRQFAQIGAEALGSDDPSLDAELIELLHRLLTTWGVGGLRLRIGSLGTPNARREYSDELRAYLRAHEGELSEEVRGRIEGNPLRAFDSDDPGTKHVMENAPRLLDRISPEDTEHFGEVRALLDAAKVPYEVDPTLVRGLDYYTRTVFEFTSDALGAQSGVGGGGRYDLLAEQLGGPPTPGVGWAAGVERIILAREAARDGYYVGPGRRSTVYIALDEGADRRAAFAMASQMRANGGRVDIEQAGRSMKGQLKHANRIGAAVVIIAGGSGYRVRDMVAGEEREAVTADEAVELAGEMYDRV
jgi:histidyl-tRNA synthetase